MEISLTEEEIFERIPRNEWWSLAAGCWESTVESYLFQKSGRYFWSAQSDIPEGSVSGSWSFQKTSPGGGHLILTGRGFLSFAFYSDETLRIVDAAFEPGH